MSGPLTYWNWASGWLEAQLQPSDLRKLLDRQIDHEAERRLKTYFFEEALWQKIPDRAVKSLISADRDWFTGSGARIESVLSELTVAVEELLMQGLWPRLKKWVEGTPGILSRQTLNTQN